MAVDRWRCYLHRSPFVIKTNHKSLVNLSDHTLYTDLQKKAMAKLAGLQVKIHYRKGADNKVADALSRVASDLEISAISECTLVWIQEVLKSYELDSQSQNMLRELALQSPNSQGFSLKDGLIYKFHQLVVGHNVGLQTKLIASFHSSAIGVILVFWQLIRELRDYSTG